MLIKTPPLASTVAAHISAIIPGACGCILQLLPDVQASDYVTLTGSYLTFLYHGASMKRADSAGTFVATHCLLDRGFSRRRRHLSYWREE